MTAWNSAKHGAHQKAYADRKRAGAAAIEQAWQGLSTAKVQDAARTAYKAVTWRYRAGGTPEAFMRDLVRVFEALVMRDQVDAWVADVPPTWTAQYPVYVAPEKREA